LQFAQAKALPKIAKELSPFQSREKLFLKNFQRFKKNKTPDTQASQKALDK